MEAKQRPRHGEERRTADGAATAAAAEEYDPWTAWLYKPHTISVLLVGACLLMGVWAMIAVFLAYCTLQAPSTTVTMLASS
nr:unnamed protein product [Digitaria exilis]